MNLATKSALMDDGALQGRARPACAIHGVPLSDSVLIAIIETACEAGIVMGEEIDSTLIPDEIVLSAVASLAAAQKDDEDDHHA